MSRVRSAVKSTRLLQFVFGASVLLCTASSAQALYEVANEGLWPKSWPTDLEPLRKQSRTLQHTAFAIYEIRFTNQEEFESAWPHILKLKSKAAPVMILSGPHKKLGATIKAGVRIISPMTGSFISPQGGRYPPRTQASVLGDKFLKIGPPWPADIRSDDGLLPKYVLADNGKWMTFHLDGAKDIPRDLIRAQLEIELIVDGDVVDLNRIPLPADTPIIDMRFKDRSNQSSN